VVAIGTLAVALSLSKPLAPGIEPSDVQLGFPAIFQVMQGFLHLIAPNLPAAALPLNRVYLHPTAVAAWVGMFATALNLLPSSQLDGGHIVYAMAPRTHRVISWITVIALVMLGRMYMGWRVWAGLLIVMNVLTYRQEQAPEYPMLPVSRWPLAVLAAIMLALTFTISPFRMAGR
jgi:membrane-associated protease RseP (regulator of RpoE activity)